MITIGITGGIGSGKTTVSALFEMMGVPVFIADEESKRLTDTSPQIRRQLTHLFGDNLYPDSQGIDRQQLATLIFHNPAHLKAVNDIIHPEVQACFRHWQSRQTSNACAIETAILFESGFDRLVDIRLMVYAPFDLRIERACRRGGQSPDDIRRRMANQLPDEDKQALCDCILLNDNRHPLLPQVEEFITTIYK